MPNPLTELKTQLGQIKDIQSAAHVLEWDQETYMPAGSAEARALQVATLRELAHERFTRDEIGELLEKAGESVNGADPLDGDAALVRVTNRDYDRARRLSSTLVADLARAVSRGKQAWKEARETDTFSVFAPLLGELIDLNTQKAHAYGFDDHAYDALLDEYEPGMTTAEVSAIFSDLRKQLVPFVHAIQDAPQPRDRFLRLFYDKQKQWDFGLDVIRDLGYDFDRGRQDLSTHPFTTSFSISDVRLTTRINEHYFPTGLFGTLHEAGHGLYEQGIDPALDRTPLAEGTSLGMHESQSRLWENLVGRSYAFWQHYYPWLQRLFSEQLESIFLDAFYQGINKVTPSLIRVEADEVTYNLHIMLRFELETALIAGQLTTNDLPVAWNDRMRDYLGVTPETDAEGVLQDIHWSLGVFGYFPTYALGNLMSTQLFNQAQTDLSDLEQQIRVGSFEALLGWLRENVHRYGRKLDAGDILERATGSRLNSDSWLAYVKDKYGQIYGLG
jgi:carboxypeptidase Taq